MDGGKLGWMDRVWPDRSVEFCLLSQKTGHCQVFKEIGRVDELGKL